MCDARKHWITLPTEKIQNYIAELQSTSSCKSMTQQQLSLHVGKIRHVASTYALFAAFARNLQVWAYSVKQLSHYIRMQALWRLI